MLPPSFEYLRPLSELIKNTFGTTFLNYMVSVGSHPAVVLDISPLEDVDSVWVGPEGPAGLVPQVVHQECPRQVRLQGQEVTGGRESVLQGPELSGRII